MRGGPEAAPGAWPARRRRCLSLTTRKRRSTGCCLPRMKKRRWRVCARFVSKRRRITRGSATSRPWKGPVACRPAWPSACCPPASAWHRLLTEHPAALDGGAGATWLNELIWREFYRHLMVYYPKLCKGRPFTAWTDKVAWRAEEAALQAWQRGETGFPIVDAAMRQLNATGWMHNRLRMIVASFLTKDLRLDWRAGERYFMSQLIDGDLAANNGGWQWAASTGTDAAPYFRIFNPTTQGEKFDKQGVFIRRWLPELAKVPEKALHQPWAWADKQGITLDYSRPIVDHKPGAAGDAGGLGGRQKRNYSTARRRVLTFSE